MRTELPNRPYGFTLIELMVVIAIVAILAAIAIPNYSRYVQRTRRSDAQQILLQVAGAEERYYATYNSYGSLAAVGFSGTPVYSANRYYQVSVPASGSTSFTATATPVSSGPQASDGCTSLSINNAGARTAAGTTRNGSCW